MWMDVSTTFRNYVDKMISSVGGMKILLLDRETVARVLLCFDLLGGDVFSNFLKNAYLERLAESDECEVVKQVQEVYADFYVLYANHASLQLQKVVGEQLNSWNPRMLTLCSEGLAAILLSLRKKPLIRYDRGSLMATKLAHEARDVVEREKDLFQFRRGDSDPIVLVLDRRADMITPLLLQWTYQAMIHDLFSINNGRVAIPTDTPTSSIENQPIALQEYALCVEQDAFYRDNLDSTFGDLGENVRILVQAFQDRTQQHQTQLDSLPSMKRFIEEYPEYRKMSAYVSKHVALAGEISKRVERLHLMQVSEEEQSIATGETGPQLSLCFIDILRRPEISKMLKLKLALLYALRFHHSATFDFLGFIDILRSCGFSADDISLIDFAVKFALPDIEPSKDGVSLASLNGRGTIMLTNKDNSNIYTRHIPPVVDIVDALVRGRLTTTNYPYVDSPSCVDRPQEIIVFIVSGTTYEEAHYLRKYTELLPGVSIVLAGTCVHSSSSFIDMLREIRDNLIH